MKHITDLTTGKIYFYYDESDRTEIITAIEQLGHRWSER